MKDELAKAGLSYFEKGAVESLNPDLRIEDQAELLPYDKKWEFPRDKLKLGKVFLIISLTFIIFNLLFLRKCIIFVVENLKT